MDAMQILYRTGLTFWGILGHCPAIMQYFRCKVWKSRCWGGTFWHFVAHRALTQGLLLGEGVCALEQSGTPWNITNFVAMPRRRPGAVCTCQRSRDGKTRPSTIWGDRTGICSELAEKAGLGKMCRILDGRNLPAAGREDCPAAFLNTKQVGAFCGADRPLDEELPHLLKERVSKENSKGPGTDAALPGANLQASCQHSTTTMALSK